MRQQATLGQFGGYAHGSPFEAHTVRPQPEGT
jgi:hypothetical protein